MSSHNLDVRKAIARFRDSSLPEELLLDLVSDSLIVRYAKEARLFLRGAPADNVMLVISGVIKIYCSHSSGREVMAALAAPGEVIGFADFVDSKGRPCMSFEAQALTNCSVALLSRQRIERVLAQLDAAGLLALLAALNTFWSSISYRCLSLLGMTFRERLEAVVAELAEKFGVRDARGTLLTLELSHDDWAALIGSSRSLASKLIAEMVDEGLLERDGKHYAVLNQARRTADWNEPVEHADGDHGNNVHNGGRAWPNGTSLAAPVPSSSSLKRIT